MSKYHSRKVTTPDGVFDSHREYDRWVNLKMMQLAGFITQLQRQVRFDLIPAAPAEHGKRAERGVSYVADFTYIDIASGGFVVEDAKGVRTPDYIIKRKLMRWIHGIEVKEV